MNYYKILKITPSATTQEIQNSYNLLIKYELNKEKINLLNKAYDILSDYHKRRNYDDILHNHIFLNNFTNNIIQDNNNSNSFFFEQIISQNTINNNGDVNTIKKIYTNNNGNITQQIITPNNNKTKTKYKIKKIE